MKVLIKFLLFAAIVAVGLAKLEPPPFSDMDNEILKDPKVTCDILGSDAACAAHCIALGYRGGYCDSQKVCRCRR